MSKMILYVVRDKLVGDSSLILTAKNSSVLKRNVKGVLLSKQPNFINTDTVDKEIYEVGELDTDTGILNGLAHPVFIVGIEELRLELIDEIRRKQAEAGIDGSSSDDDGQPQAI